MLVIILAINTETKLLEKVKAKLDKTDIDEKVIETVEAVVEAVIEVIDDE